MRTIVLTREEAMESRKELISILKNYGIYNSYAQDQFIKDAISNFEIEDMPNSTRDEKIQKLFRNIEIALMHEIAKYKKGKEKSNTDDSIKEKIYQQINSAKYNLRLDNPKNEDYKIKTEDLENLMIYPSPVDVIKYNEIENAYFDIITPKINLNDINATEQMLRERTEKMAVHIEARYGNYLEQLLEKHGYGKQDDSRGPKR